MREGERVVVPLFEGVAEVCRGGDREAIRLMSGLLVRCLFGAEISGEDETGPDRIQGLATEEVK